MAGAAAVFLHGLDFVGLFSTSSIYCFLPFGSVIVASGRPRSELCDRQREGALILGRCYTAEGPGGY